MIKTALYLLIGCLFTYNCCTAFTKAGFFHGSLSNSDKLDSLINAEGLKFVDNPKHIGLSIGIYDNGNVDTYNFGSTNKERKVLPSANTIYEIGSITKSFTGILLAQAVVDKKINLNDNVSKYLDKGYSNLIFNQVPVKIVNLANHTSGLPKNISDYPSGFTAEQIVAFYESYSQEKFLTDLKKVSLSSEPGVTYTYSNAGVQLLGIILEKVYHQTYGELVKKYITSPGSMQDTHLTMDIGAGNALVGYNGKGEKMPLCDQWKTIPAAGYICSTVNDMLKYIQFNMEKKNAAVQLSQHPTYSHTEEDNADIGLGWFVKSSGLNKKVMHAGGTFGTTSFCLMLPEQKKGIICFSNDTSSFTEKELRALSERILDYLN